MAAESSKASYLCDTLPPARISSASPDQNPRSPTPPVSAFQAPIVDNSALQLLTKPVTPSQAIADYIQPPARKLCVRHQRMADEGTNLKLQQVSLSSGFGGRVTASVRMWLRIMDDGFGILRTFVRGGYSQGISIRTLVARPRTTFPC